MRLVLAVWSREKLHADVLEAARAAAGDKPLANDRKMSIRDGVAVIPITGPLFRHAGIMSALSGATSYERIGADLQTALDDESVKQILLRVDSPGGEVKGLQELAARVRAADGKKPVTAYAESQASSAAYWLSAAAREIVAAPTALLGSIGCRISMVDDTVARHGTGERDVEIVSQLSPKKGGSPTDGGYLARMQERADYMAGIFVDSIATLRGVTREKVLTDYGEGAELIGAQAVAAGLADRLGSFDELLAGLQALATAPAPRAPRAAEDTQPPAPPTAQEKITMSTTPPTPAPEPAPAVQAQAIDQELAELRAMRASLAEATGQTATDAILGAIDGYKASAAKAIREGEGAQVKAMVAQAIVDGQIAPKDRAHYEAQSIGRMRSFVETAAKDPPVQTPPKSAGPVPAKSAAERVTSSDIDAKTAARKLLGKDKE